MNKAAPFTGLRVLVVEDERLSASQVEDILHRFGCKIIGAAGSAIDAVGLIRSEAIDVAVIDVKLQDQMAYSLADVLKTADVPFIFATGLLGIQIADGYLHVPVVGKPFDEGELRGAILEAIDGRWRRGGSAKLK
jgi:CheY-like chemotaxis protein